MIPPQQPEKKPGQLEQWQLEQYFDKGFVVLPNFFTKEEMQPAIEVGQLIIYNTKPASSYSTSAGIKKNMYACSITLK